MKLNFTKALIAFSVTNFVVFVLGSLIPGRYLVFGNALASPARALIVTSILIALIVSTLGKIAEVYKVQFSDMVWAFIYLVVNVLSLYLLARMGISEVVGVGVKAYWVAVVLGFVLNAAQYGTWKMFLAPAKKKKK